MKTLKFEFARLALYLKKFFFKCKDVIQKYDIKEVNQEKSSSDNAVDIMRYNEYVTKYKFTTRWQTV